MYYISFPVLLLMHSDSPEKQWLCPSLEPLHPLFATPSYGVLLDTEDRRIVIVDDCLHNIYLL